MPNILKISVAMGLLAGLLVGGFDNIFTVPVLERAIIFEEKRSASHLQAPVSQDLHDTSVSLGVQRVGLVAGNVARGLIFGLLFAAGFGVLRRVAENWPTVALAATVGILAFWSISLFPFFKYPLNPPGVGDEATLLFRQSFQYLTILLSALGLIGLLLGFQRLRGMTFHNMSGLQIFALSIGAYIIYMLVLFMAIPGNPDPVPVPIDLLELFRALTMIGHFLHWALLATGVALTFILYGKKTHERGSGPFTRPNSEISAD